MRNIYIYGAGAHGKIFLKTLLDENINVLGFIDRNHEIKQKYGFPVYREEDIADKTVMVLISVGMISKKIKNDLTILGYTNVMDFTESVIEYPSIIHHLKAYSLWFSETEEHMINEKNLNIFFDLLKDEKSKNLLTQIIAFRKNFNANTYVKPDDNLQYLPKDIDIFKDVKSLRFVDGGAYTGDTLKLLFEQCQIRDKPIEWIACFEPDQKNLESLNIEVERIKKYQAHTKILVYSNGLWDKNEKLYFNSGHAASSNINISELDSTLSITGVSIDDTLFHFRPNFIKLDVEGVEKKALQGAKKTIQTYHPILAVCLYHKPSDLWEIPLYIHSICNDYDLYLRVYGDMLLETVLYCIPK